ncbi:hypothetical protein [Streptomyces xanthochromogenes]|uniref:hypothetical protein n=1 Tax=Streptomyces xanthochromogenes TaxID=67384 RepID=UPI001E2BB7FE|nr:hypothetical protein [Streptomyces xanthochromogenes]
MKTSVNTVSFSTAKKDRMSLADLAATTDPAAEKKIARVVPASGSRPMTNGASFNSSL